jgi:hypothetical protein
MIHILRTHLTVTCEFILHVQHMLDPDGLYTADSIRMPGTDSRSRRPGSIWRHETFVPQQPTDSEEDRRNYRWFMLNAYELKTKMISRFDEVKYLKANAQSTSDSVRVQF